MEIGLLFPVPIWSKQLNIDASIIADIKDVCIKLNKKVPGRVISNRGGYQSKDVSSILYNKYPLNEIYNGINESIKFIEESLHIDSHISLRLGNMWVNINRKGDKNISHNHPRSIFSGVVYINSCDDKQGVVFENPHPAEQFYLNGVISNNTPLSSNYYRVPSIPGMLYIFPPWLIHHVPEYEGVDERITIAFNIC